MKAITIIYFCVLLTATSTAFIFAYNTNWEKEILNFLTAYIFTTFSLLFLNRTSNIFNYSNRLDNILNLFLVISTVFFILLHSLLNQIAYGITKSIDYETIIPINVLSIVIVVLGIYHLTEKVTKLT